MAGLLHLSGSRLLVSIGGDDFTASEARVKARQLRELADAVDVMANKAEKAAGVEAMAAEFDAMREGADETLTKFLDRATAVLRKFGDPKAYAEWFLAAAESPAGGAR